MTARTRSPGVTPAVLDAKEAATYVGLGIGLFRDAVRSGEIAYIADKGPLRFRPADLDAYMERKRKPAAWEQQPPAVKTRVGRAMLALPTTGVNAVTGKAWSAER